jgi:integrase
VARQGTQRRVERGIYVDDTGYSVKVQVRGARQELRFPAGTALERLQQQRDQLRADLHDVSPTLERGTLAADAVRYLKRIANRAGSKADASHLRAWIDRLGPKLRSRVTKEDVELALAAWRKAGTHVGGRGTRARKPLDTPASETTIKERYRVLRHLYKTLDGPKAKTPLDDVARPRPATRTPVGVSVTIVQRVANALAARAQGTPMKSAARQDYARYVMLTTTAQRPAQLQRAIAEDFHLREQFWIVRGAKGGPTHAIHLNKEMRQAVKLLLAAGALGPYDTTALLEVARAHGWPKQLPLYNARHSVAIDAIEAGADLGDVQALLGHASIETTRRFYAGILRLRQKAVGKRLEGRLKVG